MLDGFHRNTREVRGLGFPAFSSGSYAQDQRLRDRVMDFRCHLGFRNGAVVAPGDLVLGDIDGVLAVPRDQVGDIIEAALAKAEGEGAVRGMIEAGAFYGACSGRAAAASRNIGRASGWMAIPALVADRTSPAAGRRK